LKEKLEKYGTQVYLVNTGWSGGAYGVGKRMSIKTTRACVSAILDGTAASAEWKKDPVFGFEVPTSLGEIPTSVLVARESWADKAAFDAQAAKLSSMFKENFKKYVQPGKTDYTSGGPV